MTRTQREALAVLYGLLADRCPSTGVLVARAAAMVDAGGHRQALDLLLGLLPASVSWYQPYWVTLAHARAAAGQRSEASESMQSAIGLTEDAAVRRFLADWRMAP